MKNSETTTGPSRNNKQEKIVQFNKQKVYYDYDQIQDMLYMTLSRQVGPTYYSDVEGLDGVMLRYDGQSEELVGITVHNVQHKLQRWLVEDLCQRFLAPMQAKAA